MSGNVTKIGDISKIELTLGNILVKRIKREKDGLIILPEIQKKMSHIGVVVKTNGTAVKVDKLTNRVPAGPMTIMVGDTVVFKPFAGFIMENEEREEFLVMEQDDILAVVVKESGDNKMDIMG